METTQTSQYCVALISNCHTPPSFQKQNTGQIARSS
jgi:hypothetical protein